MTYSWLCSDDIEKLYDVEPWLDWPDFHPGVCELCKRDLTVFTTEGME